MLLGERSVERTANRRFSEDQFLSVGQSLLQGRTPFDPRWINEVIKVDRSLRLLASFLQSFDLEIECCTEFTAAVGESLLVEIENDVISFRRNSREAMFENSLRLRIATALVAERCVF